MHKKLLTLSLLTGLFSASAHNMWIDPSQTQLSGEKGWVTFGVGASTEPFVADHAGLGLDDFKVLSPTGEVVEKQNAMKGKVRSVFDIELQDSGTYHIQGIRAGVFARYEVDGERKRWRGSADDVMRGNYPHDLDLQKALFFVGQIESFVTLNGLSEGATTPSKYGLDVDYQTHPNDLYTNSISEFRAIIDGQPAKDVEVTIIRKGVQYLDNNKKVTLKSNDNGVFKVRWNKPGMYWMKLTSEDQQSIIPNGKRRLVYAATLQVLPE